MSQDQNSFAERISYFFNHLANMAFIAKIDSKNEKKFIVDKYNDKVKRFFGEIPLPLPLEYFLPTLITDKNVVREYFQIIDAIHDSSQVISYNREWKYFDVSVVGKVDGIDEIFLKTVSPIGYKTSIHPFNGYKDGVYVDIFTATQIIDGKIVGLQGMLPIANERREAYLMYQKQLELTLFHHLKVDMKRIPVMVKNIFERDSTISADTKKILESISKYSNTFLEQADDVLHLFHEYVTTNSTFPWIKISELEKECSELIKTYSQQVTIEYEFEKGILDYETILFPKVFSFIAVQFINNAINEYDDLKTPPTQRKVRISISKTGSPLRLKLSLWNANTSADEVVIDNAGIKPLTSASTGLGFYFLNFILEVFRAVKPENQEKRYFDIKTSPNQPKWFEIDMFFLLNK